MLRSTVLHFASLGLTIGVFTGSLAAINAINNHLEMQACITSAKLDHRPVSDCNR